MSGWRWDSGLGGAVAIRGFLEERISAYDEYAVDVNELSEPAPGIVFAASRSEARLRGGAAVTRQNRAYVFVFVRALIGRATATATLTRGVLPPSGLPRNASRRCVRARPDGYVRGVSERLSFLAMTLRHDPPPGSSSVAVSGWCSRSQRM